MSALPGQHLTVAALSGADRHVDALAAAWLPHVYRWCHRLGGPRIDAEDAAHDALLLMCKRLHKVRGPEVFPSWLFGVCKRVVANHRRRAWVRKWVPGASVERPSAAWSPLRTVEARQDSLDVWHILEDMPASQREVLVLCVLEERRCPEAAALLDVPLGTVKSRLRSARAGFKSRWVELRGDYDSAKEAV